MLATAIPHDSASRAQGQYLGAWDFVMLAPSNELALQAFEIGHSRLDGGHDCGCLSRERTPGLQDFDQSKCSAATELLSKRSTEEMLGGM